MEGLICNSWKETAASKGISVKDPPFVRHLCLHVDHHVFHWRNSGHRARHIPTFDVSEISNVLFISEIFKAVSHCRDKCLSTDSLDICMYNIICVCVKISAIQDISVRDTGLQQYRAMVQWYRQGKTEVRRKQNIPGPLFIPQVPHGQAWIRPRCS